MNLRHFQVLRAVWQSGSTTEAGRVLHVSQPAVSKMLREAEEQLGYQVFDREAGRLKMRPEAEALISAIERIFLDVEAVHLMAMRLKSPRQAPVRIAGLTSFTQTLIPVATAAFRERFPGTPLEIHSLQAEEVIDRVASGKADLGVIQSGGDPSVVETLSSFRTQVVCAMHPSHPLAARQRVRIEELKEHAVISYHLNEPSTLRVAEVFREVGETLAPVMTVSNAGTAVAMAERGVGVALITSVVLSTWHGEPPVVLRELEPGIRLKLRIVAASDRLPTPEVDHFAQALSAAAQALVGRPPEEDPPAA